VTDSNNRYIAGEVNENGEVEENGPGATALANLAITRVRVLGDLTALRAQLQDGGPD
jgi:hypothetical protein